MWPQRREIFEFGATSEFCGSGEAKDFDFGAIMNVLFFVVILAAAANATSGIVARWL